MKIQKISFIAYITLTIVVSWLVYDWFNPNYEKRFRQNSEEFAENRINFEKLITNIKLLYVDSSKGKLNLTELSKTLSEQYQEQLDEIGIENLEISFDEDLQCSEKLTFTFNVKSGYNIRRLGVVKIIYSPCNPSTKKGFHYNSGLIDTIGQGENWLIFSDTDAI